MPADVLQFVLVASSLSHGAAQQELPPAPVHHQDLGVVVSVHGLRLPGPAVGVTGTAMVRVQHWA